MKKLTLFTLLALLSSLSIWAQIPNSGFESWTTVPNDNHLTYFRSNDKDDGSIVKHQPAHGGNYALKMVTIADSENPLIGKSEFCINSFNPSPMGNGGGVPYSQKPTKLSVYAKYDIKAGDKATISVAFKKNGVALTTFADNIFAITGAYTSGYQKLEFNINGLTQTPDTVVFVLGSTDINYALGNPGAVTPQIGSYIIYDDISFDTPNPIPYMDFEAWGRPVLLPDGWTAPNSYEVIVSLNSLNPLVKTSVAHSGNSALLVRPYFNAYMNLPQDQYQAIATTGDYGSWDKVKKFPCTIQKGCFTGFYKYLPSNAGERANISISFYKNGTLVDYGMGVDITTASSTYKQFTVPFDLSVQPDMAQINIVSNTTATSASLGTELYVDDLNISEGLTYSVTVPAGTKACYICGAMTGWSVFEPMVKIDETHYTITINGATPAAEYKYSSGPGWGYSDVAQPNRIYSPNDIVTGWQTTYDPAAAAVDVVYDVTVPSTNTCYIWGNCTSWAGVEMTKISNTHFTITLHIDPSLKNGYKYSPDATLDHVELTAGGSAVYRSYSANDVVAKWQGLSTSLGALDAIGARVFASESSVKVSIPFGEVQIFNIMGVLVEAASVSDEFVSKPLAAGFYIVVVNGVSTKIEIR